MIGALPLVASIPPRSRTRAISSFSCFRQDIDEHDRRSYYFRAIDAGEKRYSRSWKLVTRHQYEGGHPKRKQFCKEASAPARRFHQQTYREFKEALRLQRMGLTPATNHAALPAHQQQPLSRIGPSKSVSTLSSSLSGDSFSVSKSSAPHSILTRIHNMNAPGGKRKRITLDQKAAMIRAVESGTKKGNVARDFGVSMSTLSTILSKQESIIDAVARSVKGSAKRMRAPAFEVVERESF
ncbi:hypothetical protein HPB51_015658 [Rhipicephalus microplus]|uniref:HTH psq-type domain-containing protein n=1 Tax=Rhipicephalus microplus TaxID=6941 RepID=A0A9J6D669_RHIMP|nr:hypothetical protein HPB51_015658 [Rhipicephalus microplus]